MPPLCAVHLGLILNRSSRNDADRKENNQNEIKIPAVDDCPERSRDVTC
jgi:hypothetical protein